MDRVLFHNRLDANSNNAQTWLNVSGLRVDQRRAHTHRAKTTIIV
jgi:hypothetical protein